VRPTSSQHGGGYHGDKKIRDIILSNSWQRQVPKVNLGNFGKALNLGFFLPILLHTIFLKSKNATKNKKIK